METFLNDIGMAKGVNDAACRLEVASRKCISAPIETMEADYSSLWTAIVQTLSTLTSAVYWLTLSKKGTREKLVETSTEPTPQVQFPRSEVLGRAAKRHFMLALAVRKNNAVDMVITDLAQIVCGECELILGDSTEYGYRMSDSERTVIGNILFQEDRAMAKYKTEVAVVHGNSPKKYQSRMENVIAEIYAIADKAKFVNSNQEKHNAMAVGLGTLLHERAAFCVGEEVK